MPEEYKTLLAGVAREAFDDVIPRFHIVHGAPIAPAIFTFTGKVGKAGDTIELTNGGRQFLIDYKKLIDYVAVSGWVRFTEAIYFGPKVARQNRWHQFEKGRGLAMAQTRSWQYKTEDAFTTRTMTWLRQKSIMYCRGHSFWKIGLGTLSSLVASATTKSGINWQIWMR